MASLEDFFHFTAVSLTKIADDDLSGTVALIKAVEGYAIVLGAGKIELDYMSASPWLKLNYERYGYAETGEVIHWGTPNLICMAKTLT
jgi:hypothetical protein